MPSPKQTLVMAEVNGADWLRNKLFFFHLSAIQELEGFKDNTAVVSLAVQVHFDVELSLQPGRNNVLASHRTEPSANSVC